MFGVWRTSGVIMTFCGPEMIQTCPVAPPPSNYECEAKWSRPEPMRALSPGLRALKQTRQSDINGSVSV